MPEYEGAYTFISAEQAGTGTVQNIAHTLGKVPERVVAFLTGGPASYTQPTIVLGAHDATNLVVSVTNGWKYRLLAYA